MPSEEPPAERRPRLTPPIADVRRAVRAVLPDAAGATERVAGRFDRHADATPGMSPDGPATREPLVLVALSGGADSLALAAATAFEAPRAGLRAGAVIVDHGLQAASAVAATSAGRSGSTPWSCGGSR